MALNTETISGANDTLSKRRQINTSKMLKRQKEVYSIIPEIEDIGYEITATGASYTMAKLAKNEEQAQILKKQMEDLQLKRNNLLVENNFATDYLDPIYSCNICKDKGFVNGKICNCLQQEIIKQRQNMLTGLSPAPKTTFEQFSLDFYPDITDEKGSNPHQQMKQIFAYCQSYAKNFSRKRKSVFMCGNSGLGKTHLSCAIANVCVNNGFIVMYASSQSLFNQIETNKQDVQNILNDIINCDLFILDDLGTEYLTPYGLSVLYNIINTRMINSTPCIFSTNLTSQKSLTAKYGEKITSRLIGSCDTLYFIGEDIRFKKK